MWAEVAFASLFLSEQAPRVLWTAFARGNARCLTRLHGISA